MIKSTVHKIWVEFKIEWLGKTWQVRRNGAEDANALKGKIFLYNLKA